LFDQLVNRLIGHDSNIGAFTAPDRFRQQFGWIPFCDRFGVRLPFKSGSLAALANV
jgi:hypothetical protein